MSLPQSLPKFEDLLIDSGHEIKFDETWQFWKDHPITYDLGHGVTAIITKEGEVTITGYKKLTFAQGDATVDIAGENVNIEASETLTLKADHHAIVEADRVDLNPDRDDFDFQNHIRKLRRNGTTSL